MKILVTGSAGFIGFYLVNELLKYGYEVVGIDSINDYYDVNLKFGRLSFAGILPKGYAKNVISIKNKNYKFIKANLEDEELLEKIFKEEKFDAVCNLAAQPGVRYSLVNPKAYIKSNIVGFMNLLECCKNFNVSNFSFASSSSVYGLNDKMPFSTNDNVDHPVSVYAATKKSNELLAHAYSHLYDIKATGLRFFTVYGPWGRPDMAPFIFLKAAMENKAINVFNNGDMLRDFTYVEDIAKGVVRIIQNPASKDESWCKTHNANSSSAAYRIYNIGSNNPIKLMDFIKAIESKIGREIKKNYSPMQPGDVKATYADVSDLVNDFNYKPDTALEVGISKFVDWYLNFYK